MLFFVLSLLLLSFKAVRSLDCTQIQDSQIWAGNKICLPGPSCSPQVLPANFNCRYLITVPTTDVSGLYANVTVFNGMKGVNDFIRVQDVTYTDHVLNSRQGNSTNLYYVIPGADIRVEVNTKSVLMNSQFGIIVSYGSAQIGPVYQMKTGGEMNFFDMATTRDGQGAFTSVTFYTDEVDEDDDGITFTIVANNLYPDGCSTCYIIGGNLTYPWEINAWARIAEFGGFSSGRNMLTVVSFQDGYAGFVLNSPSEAKPFRIISALAATTNYTYSNMKGYSGRSDAVEVVNFQSKGIVFDYLAMWSDHKDCSAYVESGPPNNSSQVLLDLFKWSKPVYFDLQYFTIINNNCTFDYAVKSYTP